MQIKTETIFKGRTYTACVLADKSLVVTRNRKHASTLRGRRLLASASYHWIVAIKTAIDHDEAHALCAAIIRAA